jgi:ferredoxin-NADP reductase
MKQYIVKIKSIVHINHDVLQLITEKPEAFDFIPGQATHISINKPDWKAKKNPFTFTCLPENDYLEFTIKTYPAHKGVTNELLKLRKDDELILHDVFGSITYKGEGVFIAGGAGVTPFISIFRNLQSRNEIGKNKLIFANKMKRDIILKDEFEDILGRNFVNILSDEQLEEYPHGLITEGFLEEYVNGLTKHVYVCGPPTMMEAVLKQLSNLGVPKDAIIVEAF